MGEIESLLNITEEPKGDILILRISGRLDAVSSSGAEKKVFDHINDGHIKLLVDLSGVDYLSSAGLRMLLSTSKKLKALSGKLVIYSVSMNVMDVLKMSGFDHVLDIAANQDEGIRKF